jgi:uncharacterized protein YciI
MRYVALLRHGRSWTPGKSVYEQGQPIVDHLDSMRRRFDEGTLLLGGPFGDGRGGLAILDVVDEARATELMDKDPGVVAGVLAYELHPLLAYFDAYDGSRTELTVAQLRYQHVSGTS